MEDIENEKSDGYTVCPGYLRVNFRKIKEANSRNKDFSCRIHKNGEAYMRKKDPGYNRYYKRRLLSMEKQRLKRKNYHKHSLDSQANVAIPEDGRYISTIPTVFSIVDNPKKTVKYFNELINNILRNESIGRVFFNFRDVEHLTVDALMYLLAILKFLKCRVWEFSGNIPLREAPKELFCQSGFLRMIRNQNVAIAPNDLMYMCAGNNANSKETANVCRFIHAHSAATRKDTGFIYDMLMELEVNTADHAYSKNANPLFVDNWLMLVEDAGAIFKFTFLDVGVGICKTIYKRWHEKINLGKSQVDYLISAFNGALIRTETRLAHRGKGLPKIKQYSDEHQIGRLKVVTNRAFC